MNLARWRILNFGRCSIFNRGVESSTLNVLWLCKKSRKSWLSNWPFTLHLLCDMIHPDFVLLFYRAINTLDAFNIHCFAGRSLRLSSTIATLPTYLAIWWEFSRTLLVGSLNWWKIYTMRWPKCHIPLMFRGLVLMKRLFATSVPRPQTLSNWIKTRLFSWMKLDWGHCSWSYGWTFYGVGEISNYECINGNWMRQLFIWVIFISLVWNQVFTCFGPRLIRLFCENYRKRYISLLM